MQRDQHRWWWDEQEKDLGLDDMAEPRPDLEAYQPLHFLSMLSMLLGQKFANYY
jgi:hypothetical protein